MSAPSTESGSPLVLDEGNPLGAANTRRVTVITAVMMAAEIAAGWAFGSMALLADGWHMSTHVVALGVTAVAYALSGRLRRDPSFAFGAWKIEVLGGFASAVVLMIVAIYMAVESIVRFCAPTAIVYDQALIVAVVGLVVNLLCARLLMDSHDHHHDHAHDHPHDVHSDQASHHGSTAGRSAAHDLNLRSAYVHVITDAMTSVFAIVAIVGAKLFHWNRLDPAMGVVGAVVVAVWAISLLRETSRVLLDREMDDPIAGAIRALIEADGRSKLRDLRLIRVGRGRFAAFLTIGAGDESSADVFRRRLSSLGAVRHTVIEVRAEGQASAAR